MDSCKIQYSGNGFQDYSHLPLIMRSRYRDLWAWKDSTGKRFRQFQMHVQDEDFLEQLHSINREEFHPLSSFDKVLLFSMVPQLMAWTGFNIASHDLRSTDESALVKDENQTIWLSIFDVKIHS